MAICSELSKTEHAIRSAVISASYDEVTLLLSSYDTRFKLELQNASMDSRQLTDTISHTKELLEWVFRMVSAARAHDGAHLTKLLSVSPYRLTEPNQCHSWQLEA